MTVEGIPISPVETISPPVKFAAQFVPVGDYLKLRYKNGQNITEGTFHHLSRMITTINDISAKHGDIYQWKEAVKYTANPFTFAVRGYLASVPLIQYLSARKEFLVSAITKNNLKIQKYDEGLEEQHLDHLENKSINLSNKLDLIDAVAEAAGITLS